MKNAKRILMLVLAMAMLITALPVCAAEDGDVTETAVKLGAPPAVEPSAPSYIPYINDGTGEISENFTVTSVNVTDLYGDEVKTADIKAGDSVLVSCRLKATETGKNKTIKLLSAAYNASNCLVGAEISNVLTLDGTVQDIAVYLTVSEAVANIKSYIWEGSIENLVPLSECADLKSNGVKVNSITFDGDTVDLEADFTAEGNVYTYNETIEIPASELTMPEIKVSTDNLAARCEVSCDKGFPLSKQGDTEAATATITVKVSLDGATKAEYKFPVSQAAPVISNAKQKQWATTTATDTTTSLVDISSANLVTIKEANYDKGYKRSEVTSSTISDLLKTKGLPSDFTALHSDRGLWAIFNISPEFNGGTLVRLSQTNSDNTISVSKLHGSTLSAIGDLVTFDINRSATVYVWDNTASTNGYTTNYTADTTLKLYFMNTTNASNGGSVQSRLNTWYKKHFDVTNEGTVSVGVPSGFRAPVIIVKFDDMEYPSYSAKADTTAIKSATYTQTFKGEEENVVSTPSIDTVINPVVSDYDIEFDPGVSGVWDTAANSLVSLGTPSTPFVPYKGYTTKSYPGKSDVLIDYNKLWTGDDGGMFVAWEWKSDVLGGEVVQMPFIKWNNTNTTIGGPVKDIEIELDASADVYLQFRASMTEEQFIKAEFDMVSDGWRRTEPVMKKIWASSTIGSSGRSYMFTAQVFDNVPTEQTDSITVMKHFEVPEGETVKVTIGGGYDISQISKANAFPFVVVKRADRAEY